MLNYMSIWNKENPLRITGKMVLMRIQPFITIARTKSLWTVGKLSFSSSSTMAKC